MAIPDASPNTRGLVNTGPQTFGGTKKQIDTSLQGGPARILLHPTVSILDFGADPTGVADSQPAFMAAIASFSPVNDLAAGCIIVPPGQYRLASTVRVKKCVWISGSQAGSGCTIKPDAGITAFKFERYNTATDLGGGRGDASRLSNLTIRNANHKVNVWMQGETVAVGTRRKVGPRPNQGAMTWTDSNEFYRHYECTTSGVTSVSGSGPKSQGHDQLLNYKLLTANFSIYLFIQGATSGAEARIIADTNTGTMGQLRLTSVSGVFIDGETLTHTDESGVVHVHAVADGVAVAAAQDELDGSACWKYIGAGSGVHIRANGVTLQDVLVDNMSGNGIHVVGNDLEDPGAASNANGWQFINVGISNCDGHGLYLRGSDTNGGTWVGGFCAGNGGTGTDEDFGGPGWNLYDASFLGNTYVGVEFYAGAGQGGVFNNSIGGGSTFVGCYQEGTGGGHNIFTTRAVVVGGAMADSDFRSTGQATGDEHWNPAAVSLIGTARTSGLVHSITGLSAVQWRPSVYAPKGIQRSNAGNVYTCVGAGVTASSGLGPTGTAAGISDGTAVWDYAGKLANEGYVVLGSTDPSYKTIAAAQPPSDISVGLSHYDRYEENNGLATECRTNKYGISGVNGTQVQGNGIGRMIAHNKTVWREWPTKIPAGKEMYDQLWLGGCRMQWSDVTTDPIEGTWNPGDRMYFKGAAIIAGGAEGKICTIGGTAGTYSGSRTATADGTNIIVLSGAPMSTLVDQQDLRVGDYVDIGGSGKLHVLGVSDDGLTVTLDRPVSAGSGKSIVFIAPAFKMFGAIST